MFVSLRLQLILLVLGSASLCLRGQETIKIGEFASLTGKEAAFGQSSHRGTVLAIEKINAGGGVLGKQIKLMVEDNESKPGETTTAVRKLISRDKVVALLGEVASSRSLEAAPIAQHAHIPMVSPSSTNPEVTQRGPYIFRVCFIDSFQGAVLSKFALDSLHARRIGILSSVSSAYSVGLARYFTESFAAGGGTVAIEQKYSEGDKDFMAQLTAIRAEGVDAVFVPGYYTEVALIAKQARELGLAVPLFGGDGWEAPQLLEIGGTAVEGYCYSTHFSPENPAPIVREFVQAFQKRWGGQAPDAMAALGYDSALVLADAIRRAGSTDGAKIRDALAATSNFAGVTGMTSMDAERNAAKTAVIVTIKDGRFRFLQSAAP